MRALITSLLILAVQGIPCSNSPDWETKKGKNCGWVAKEPSKRCKSKGTDKTKANASCQASCNTCSCVNSDIWRHANKKGKLKNCNWVQKKPARCGKMGVDNTKAKTKCRLACGTCIPDRTPTLLPSNPPTHSPTVSPTQSPTVSLTQSPTVSPTQSPIVSPSHSPTASPEYSPVFQGPFITADNSSEIIVVPNPPIPDLEIPRTNCPHLQSGLMSWHDPSTWGAGGIVPTSGDITLPDDSKILVSQTITPVLGLITVPATSQLIFGENIEGITMDATGFEVTGSLIAGSQTCRLETPLIITLHGMRPDDIVTNPKPPSFKGISVTGVLQMHGKRFYRTWTRLAKTASLGDDFLFVQHPVNWEQGQDLVLVTTAVKDSRDWHQNEMLTVASVRTGPEEGVPAVVYLTSPVQEMHVANSGYQAEVGLLSRMITVQGAFDDSEPTDPDPGGCIGPSIFGDTGRPCEDTELKGYGGHIIVHQDGLGYVEGVKLHRMGQTNVLGRYPIHFHILGNGCEGCYFRDSSVHRSYYRCISLHGTNGMVVSENVAYDVTGYCYYLEDGVEEYNTISFNLAAFIHMLGTPARGNGQTTPLVYQSEDITLPADATAAGYYITNLRNTIIGNAASGGWAGFAFPVFHSPVGAHREVNMRPANRLALTINGNTAHSTGWWWGHAGAFYFGGTLYYDNNILVYNAGRDQSRNRVPCLVDKCAGGNCDSYCQGGERAWNRITNSKAFLIPSVGLNSWSGRMEVVGFEAHDVGLGLEALEPGFFINDLLVVCRTGETWAMPLNTRANYISGSGFFWYDTGQEHIIVDAIFRNCGQRIGYSEYDQSPTRGCDNSKENGCGSDSTVFGFLTHSDQFTPEIMQATRNISFEDCGRRFRLHDFRTNNAVPTVSGRNQNWLDLDGSASGLEEPTLIGSGLPSAGLWWKVDAEVVHDPHGPLEFIKQNLGPERGLGHIRIEWDDEVHQTVGSSSCGNGNGIDCPTLGRIRHFGPMFNLSTDPLGGLPITAQAEVVGPVGGFGWLLSLDGGAPKQLRIKYVEVSPSTPLILSIAYPLGTSFAIGANAAYCSPGASYSCQEDFKEVDSQTAVRYSAGNTFYFDKTKGLLYLRIIMPPQTFTGDKLLTASPTWHLWDYDTPGKWGSWWAIDRFSRANVTLPKFSYGPYLTIKADCPASDAFCSERPTEMEPEVCSSGYEQVAYDKCCMVSSSLVCEFSPSLAPTTSAPTPAPDPNLVTNPGFESGTENWFSLGSTTTIAQELSNPHTGSYTVLVTKRTLLWHGIAQDLLSVLQPDTATYNVSCWVRLKSTSSASFLLSITKTDDNGQAWMSVSATISNSWTYVSGSITIQVTGDMTDAILYAEGPEYGVDFYLDDVNVFLQ